MANYLFSWLLFFLFFLSNFCFSEGPYIFLSNFKKNVPSLFQQISTDHIQNEEDALAIVKSILDQFSERLPAYKDMVNNKEQPVSVNKLIISAFESENVEIRNMIYFVLTQLINGDEQQKSNELFIFLAQGFLESQEIQYKTLVELYWQVRKISSLEVLIYDLLDNQKREWVTKTIHQLEKNLQAITPEIEIAYMRALQQNNEFGIALEGEEKNGSMKKFQNTQSIREVFCTLVNTNEFFMRVVNRLQSLKEDFERAELHKWALDHNYNLNEIFDDKGIVTELGVEKILIDLRIIAHVDKNFLPDLMQRQKIIFQSLFESNEAKTWNEYQDRLNSTKEYEAIRNIFRNNKYSFTIFAPEKSRISILSEGLKNRYETGTTGGHSNPITRYRSETCFLSEKLENYMHYPWEYRPRFAHITSNNLPTQAYKGSQFGSDVYFIESETIKEYTTFTLCGSTRNYLTRQQAQPNIIVKDPTEWGHLFVPMDFIDAAIPFLNEKNFLKSTSYVTSPNKAFINSDCLGIDLSFNIIEAQIFCPIKTSMISKFIFTVNPPNSQELKLLAKNNIKVLDGRGTKIVPYNCGFYDYQDGECQENIFLNNQWTVNIVNNEYCVAYRNVSFPAYFQKLTYNAIKNSPVIMNYFVGDVVYERDSKRLGIVNTIFSNGYLIIRYQESDGRDYFHVTDPIKIHKQSDKSSIETPKGKFSLNDEILLNISRKKAKIHSFYEQEYADVELLDKPGAIIHVKTKNLRHMSEVLSKPNKFTRLRKKD